MLSFYCKRAASFIALLLTIAFSMPVSATEIAPYDVIETDGKLELRAYPSMVLVSAPMKIDGQRNSAFRQLFSYISGGNKQEQKISMTAPVFMDAEEGDSSTMAFVMPKEMTLEATPKPDKDSIKVTQTTAQLYATIQFSGRLTDKNISKHRKLLDAWIMEKGFEVVGDAKTAGYNSPFTLPPFRRNEVLVPINAN